MSTMQTPAQKHNRLESIDFLRGLVMVLMALDHTRVFFHTTAGLDFDPLNTADGGIALYLTRWITHFCAPVFIFLAGTGAFFSSQRGRSKRDLSRFLLARGFCLIVLELTWIHWAGWLFAINPKEHAGLLIWAVGWSMIALAGLIHLPRPLVATLGIAVIVLHNALDPITPGKLGGLGRLWHILHEGGDIGFGNGFKFSVGYPLLPWIGVISAGYAFGPVMQKEPAARQHWLLRVGLNLIVVFVLLRFTNLYGDPKEWTSQPTGFRTVLSMLDCTRQPPSLCYLLMTLGPAALLLAWLDRSKPDFLKPLLVIGRVPLFFYLLHLPLIHGLAVAVNFLRFDRANWLYGTNPAKPPPDAGFDLPYVYLAWLVILLLTYPACHWFADLKSRQRDKRPSDT